MSTSNTTRLARQIARLRDAADSVDDGQLFTSAADALEAGRPVPFLKAVMADADRVIETAGGAE